jgi:taurine--2-oxoglutarate transaminase
LSHPGNATEARGLLGKKLAEVTPGDLKKTFFTLGGAEANENAIKIARFYTGRHKILARIVPITARLTAPLH